MAMLDLQNMAAPSEKAKAPAGSRASKGCNNTGSGGHGGHGGHDNTSSVSLALCAF